MFKCLVVTSHGRGWTMKVFMQRNSTLMPTHRYTKFFDTFYQMETLILRQKLLQCRIQESNGVVTRNGACPDTQNDVRAVSGYRDNCKTCIKYSRSLSSGRHIL